MKGTCGTIFFVLTQKKYIGSVRFLDILLISIVHRQSWSLSWMEASILNRKHSHTMPEEHVCLKNKAYKSFVLLTIRLIPNLMLYVQKLIGSFLKG